MPNLFPVDATGLPAFHPDVAAWRRPHSPGPLTADELDHFYEYGFIIKYGLLSPQQLQPVIASVERQVEALADSLHKAGKIQDVCADAGFYERLTRLEAQFPSVCTLLHRQGKLAPEVQQLWSSEQLMGVARQVLGPDLAGHPVWNLRTKIPTPQQAATEVHADQTTVPFHQDAAYLDSTADRVLQLTAWTPLLDAVVDNGCMQVLRGGHRPGVVSPHVGCSGASWYIEMDMAAVPSALQLQADASLVTCEVPLGSVLFLNNLIPHRSLPNLSSAIRWSFDLRWQQPQLPSGYYGLKEPILMAKADDPHFTPDWTQWADTDRHDAQSKRPQYGHTDTKFETRICGPSATHGSSCNNGSAALPLAAHHLSLCFLCICVSARPVYSWMDRWPLVHENRHTRMWQELHSEQRKAATSKA